MSRIPIKDLFGFKRQGVNYDIYRPQYTPQMINDVIEGANFNGDYIDIATGTGIVFQQIQNKFKGYKVAQDINARQIGVLMDKMQYNSDPNIKILHGDATKLVTQLKENNLPTKYDLITMGEALHWFDYDTFMPYLIENILKPGGQIGLLTYMTKETFLDVKKLEYLESKSLDPELKDSMSIFQKYFFSVMNANFDCDTENVDSGLSKYDFKKYFSTVEKKNYLYYQPMSLDFLLKYMNTYSAYQSFKVKYPTEVDPIDTYTQNIMEAYNKIRSQYNLKTVTPPLFLLHRYYTHLLRI